ncbi:DUF3999 domain-containing protein [Methylotenera sp.]|uniref:DUF3999 domain-containing protein n=1 Tax=Methylotenera sp. TaxID=2051956 RepID=UPI00272FDC7D|nr:DUF3999 domain-containing protein [Methylotenera sp.]MDP2070518.1 DUF3999 domain-containing protein [Methylotenera sp.]MDP3006119.1 DUF3999 domain-containing protein [Methylotenera sp.]
MKTTHILLAGLLTALTLAPTPVMAASFKLEASGSEPLYQSRLPKEVYQYSRSAGLQDLTITNAAGEQVPYALLPYETLHPQTITTLDVKPLVVLPINDSALTSPNERNFTVKVLENSSNSTQISVNSNTQITDSKNIYLVDAGKKHPPLQTLSVEWIDGENALLPLDVQASNDLENWSDVGHAVLLKTSNDGKVLLQNLITLDYATEARYLKLSPSEGNGKLVLTKINAEYNSVRSLTPDTLWHDVQFLQRELDTKKGVINLDFESLGRYPASYLRVHLPQTNTITSASILVRDRNDAPWQYYTTASLYRMDKSGKSYTNPDVLLNATAARYWRLQFNQSGGGIGAENPNLSLGWLPQTAVWNARGAAPFSLQVGEDQKFINTVDIAQLIPDYKIENVLQLTKASLTAVVSANNLPTGQTANAWVAPIDYKRWLLWAGLFLGVLLLAGMAYSLLKADRK